MFVLEKKKERISSASQTKRSDWWLSDESNEPSSIRSTLPLIWSLSFSFCLSDPNGLQSFDHKSPHSLASSQKYCELCLVSSYSLSLPQSLPSGPFEDISPCPQSSLKHSVAEVYLRLFEILFMESKEKHFFWILVFLTFYNKIPCFVIAISAENLLKLSYSTQLNHCSYTFLPKKLSICNTVRPQLSRSVRWWSHGLKSLAFFFSSTRWTFFFCCCKRGVA